MLEIGSLVNGKYKILSEIGHGGMGVVYMALHEKENKTWAIKEVCRNGMVDFEAVKQGLLMETNLLKRLQHPNLPSIVDVIEGEETFLLVMDYIEGKSLCKILETKGAIPQKYVIQWGKQLCDVLIYLHTSTPPVIYRDMKPSNIMLKPDGNLILIDFGTAREFKEKNLADTLCLGTVGYAAPEQFGGRGQTDARTDIYGLGATLYHLVTGYNPSKPPYEIKPIRQINMKLSGGLEQIIQKCTQPNPNDRYQSAAELMYALDHYGEFDDMYQKKQKLTLGCFMGAVILVLVFAVTGCSLDFMAEQKAADSYQKMLDEAVKTTEYTQKLKLYEECMKVPGKSGEKEAYLGLIQAYKEDAVFTVMERKQLMKCINNYKEELLKNVENYTEICFQVGKLYWYYFGYEDEIANQVTRAKNSAEWFKDVLIYASENSTYIGMARAYASIGEFYQNIASDIMEANDKGKYCLLFTNLLELLSNVASDKTESELVRLEILEFSRNTIQQYAVKFKNDGITENELMSMLELIAEMTDGIETSIDKTREKKRSVVMFLDDTKKAIQCAFRDGGLEK